jgi:hypothetical protein
MTICAGSIAEGPMMLSPLEDLLQGDVSPAIERVQHSLGISRIEAEQIAINIFDG